MYPKILFLLPWTHQKHSEKYFSQTLFYNICNNFCCEAIYRPLTCLPCDLCPVLQFAKGWWNEDCGLRRGSRRCGYHGMERQCETAHSQCWKTINSPISDITNCEIPSSLTFPLESISVLQRRDEKLKENPAAAS